MPVDQVERPAKPERLEELPVSQAEGMELLFSLSVKDADVRDVLMALTRGTPFNIVADQTVQGKATVDLKEVTLKQALEAILDPLGLTWKVDGNVIRVTKRGMETRMFKFDYVAARAAYYEYPGPTAPTAVSPAAGPTLPTARAAGVRAYPAAGIDPWADLEKELQSLKSPEGKISINRSAGIIVVTDYPEVLKKVERYLRAVEESVHRQVVIQAEIIEVILSRDRQAGLDWSVLGRLFRATQNLRAGSTMFQIGLLTDKFSLLLDALSRQGQVNILSKPRISVLNNQRAIIRVGTEDVYWRVTVEIEPTTGRRTETTTPQTITVGFVLEVTPQISEDGTVIMHIHPSVTEKTGESVSRLGDRMPIIEAREVDTMVRVKSGQTLVLGGILLDKRDQEISYLPLLSDIPFLGRTLFSRRKVRKQRSELIILITPTIARSAEGDDV